MKASRIITVVVAAGLLLSGKVMAGGACGIQWDNDASVNGNNTGYIYTAPDGLTPVANGQVLDLVAVNGVNLTILQANVMGDDTFTVSNGGDPLGSFNIATAVASNILQGVIGQSLGVLVFNGSAEALITPTGDYALASPTPDWSGAPPLPINLELDPASATVTLIAGEAAGALGDNTGFYVQEAAVPEPSSLVLVGMGLFGAIGLIRRRRQS